MPSIHSKLMNVLGWAWESFPMAAVVILICGACFFAGGISMQRPYDDDEPGRTASHRRGFASGLRSGIETADDMHYQPLAKAYLRLACDVYVNHAKDSDNAEAWKEFQATRASEVVGMLRTLEERGFDITILLDQMQIKEDYVMRYKGKRVARPGGCP